MAVPPARLPAAPGVVLHLRGGARPPAPPLSDGAPPAISVHIRRTGDTGAPAHPDLYHIPPEVATGKALPPGWYVPLAPGDEYEVVVSPNREGAAALARLTRSLPRGYDRVEAELRVDGAIAERVLLGSFDQAPTDVLFPGWPTASDEGAAQEFRRFCMHRTVGSAGVASEGAAASGAAAALGRLTLTFYPCRTVGGAGWAVGANSPPPPPPLSERDAVKDRSLTTGAGAAVVMHIGEPLTVERAGEMGKEGLALYYREARVLIARGVLVEGGEVAPPYRPGGGGKAQLGGGWGGGGAGAAAAAAVGALPAPPDPLTGVKAEAAAGSGSSRAAAGGGGGGGPAGRPRKRKAIEVIVLD